MTTADWALAISLGSLVVALLSFLWNVWSKFIYPKPKVHISFSYMTALLGPDHEQPVISLGATNHGPIAVTLKLAIIRMKRKKLRRKGYGVLIPWSNFPHLPAGSTSPFGGGLPQKLEVGEEMSVNFIPDHELLSSNEYDAIGFVDTFGRHHWTSKRQLNETRRAIQKDAERDSAAPCAITSAP